jgi:NADPH-dependent F420 reductase
MTEPSAETIRTIAILGGTGKEGKGLAYRWAKTGYHILIGSRQAEKALAAADSLRELLPNAHSVEGMANEDAARQADLVVITVPYAAHADMCALIRPLVTGKIVVDVTVPLVPPKVRKPSRFWARGSMWWLPSRTSPTSTCSKTKT